MQKNERKKERERERERDRGREGGRKKERKNKKGLPVPLSSYQKVELITIFLNVGWLCD